VGINGEPILFNRKPVQEPSKKRATPVKSKHEDLIAALGSLGLSVTREQVAAAIASLPNNGADMDEPSLIRAVFLKLKQQG
jgi:Holliday junction resolvasome RuvABC DNA-binding subunit